MLQFSKFLVSTVPELETDEVRSETSVDFVGEDGNITGETLEFREAFRALSHVEEQENRLVGGFEGKDLERPTPKEMRAKRWGWRWWAYGWEVNLGPGRRKVRQMRAVQWRFRTVNRRDLGSV